MVFDNKVEVHNAEELIPGRYGQRIGRLPQTVQQQMHRADQAHNWTGVELRFVIEQGNSATIQVYCPSEDNTVSRMCVLFLGDHQYGWEWLEARQIVSGMNDITVTLPKNMEQLAQIDEACGHRFSSRVVRLIMPSGDYELCGANGDIRPPKAEELPPQYGVFYGSSITHGSLSLNLAANYVAICGRRLGVDVLNKGVAGSCFMEPTVLDWLLTKTDAAFLSVEVGTNCFGALSAEELRWRVQHLTDRFAAEAGDRQLFLIDCLAVDARFAPCRQLVQEVVEAAACPCIHYVSGLTLLPDRQGIAVDGVHPTMDGQLGIGERYAALIQRYI